VAIRGEHPGRKRLLPFGKNEKGKKGFVLLSPPMGHKGWCCLLLECSKRSLI